MARDYAQNMFTNDLVNILNQPQNRYMIIDYAAQLFNRHHNWGLTNPTNSIQLSTYTVNANAYSSKLKGGYPTTELRGTYISFQGFLDTFYQNADPLVGFTYDSTDYNFVSDITGLYTQPLAYPTNMVATDGTLIAAAVPDGLAWETAWNNLLRPYQNQLGVSFKGRYKNILIAPPTGWPHLKLTPIPVLIGGTLTENIFRIGPDILEPSLIKDAASTADRASRGYWIALTGPTPRKSGRRSRF